MTSEQHNGRESIKASFSYSGTIKINIINFNIHTQKVRNCNYIHGMLGNDTVKAGFLKCNIIHSCRLI